MNSMLSRESRYLVELTFSVRQCTELRDNSFLTQENEQGAEKKE
jgi:hypothetical protein